MGRNVMSRAAVCCTEGGRGLSSQLKEWWLNLTIMRSHAAVESSRSFSAISSGFAVGTALERRPFHSDAVKVGAPPARPEPRDRSWPSVLDENS